MLPAIERPRGRIKERPEDFVVEEIAAYAPQGSGEHLFVRFTKRDRTTLDAVRAIARALGCDPRAAGVAGMKDRRAVTTQTISLQAPRGQSALELSVRARDLALDGIQVHEATPHRHKIKPGHLAGNRFAITLRGILPGRLDEVGRALESIAKSGVPNAFGPQRFGIDGRNTERALAWVRGEQRGPRDPRLLRLLWSSLQSAIFNAVLEARVADSTWTTPLEGDLLEVRGSGGLFVCSDVQTDGRRASAGEISPTGPMIGVRMRWPEASPLELERQIVARMLGEGTDLSRTRRVGEGSRRALRVWVDDLRWEILASTERESAGPEPAACVRVYFVLPKGAYATTVLATALAIDESRGESGGRDDEESTGEFTH
ncbi:MAG TPA: tRNA pseudouridine(13) synthase TruD [Polyangiaceae bacterium]|nr:tRNA pseudouridine(13) synthase TruD [Polyangiaceae bacterium]